MKFLSKVILALSTAAIAQAASAQLTTTAWLRGDFNAWGKTAMSVTGSGAFPERTATATVTVGANPGNFKFDFSAAGNWSDNYGDNNAADLVNGWKTANQNGGNIAFPCGAGTYTITYSTYAGASSQGAPAGSFYKVEKVGGCFTSVYPSMNLRGSANGWGNIPMTLVRNNVWSAGIATVKGALSYVKFDVTGNWSTNFGDANPVAGVYNGVAEQGAANIAVLGCYQGCGATVRFNDLTKEYAVCALGGSNSALCQ